MAGAGAGAGADAERSGLDRAATTVVLVLAWGSTFAAVKVGLEAAPPILFAGLRSLVGAAVLVPVALWRGGRPRIAEHWQIHLWLSLTNIVVFFALQTLAILALPSGMAAVLIYLQPVLVGLLAWRLLDERMGPAKVLGLLLGFAGIVVVSAGALEGSLSGAGIAEAVLSALAWAVGTILFKVAQDVVDAWWAVAAPFAIGAVVLTGAGLLLEGAQIDWSARFVVALLYTGLIGTALAWVLWLRLLTSGEATRAATYIFFVPIVSVLIGATFLGEPLGLTLVAGGVLVVAGVYLVNRPSRSAQPASPGRTRPDS